MSFLHPTTGNGILSPKGRELTKTLCEWLDKLPPGHAEASFAKIAAFFKIELGIFPEALPDAVVVKTSLSRIWVSDFVQAAVREINEQLDPIDQHEVIIAVAIAMNVPILDDVATRH